MSRNPKLQLLEQSPQHVTQLSSFCILKDVLWTFIICFPPFTIHMFKLHISIFLAFLFFFTVPVILSFNWQFFSSQYFAQLFIQRTQKRLSWLEVESSLTSYIYEWGRLCPKWGVTLRVPHNSGNECNGVI